MKYVSIYEGRDWEGKSEDIQYTTDMDAAEIYDDWCKSLLCWTGDGGEWGEEDEEWWLEVLQENSDAEKIREDLKQALGLIVSPDDWETLRKDLIRVIGKSESLCDECGKEGSTQREDNMHLCEECWQEEILYRVKNDPNWKVIKSE